MVDKAKGKNLKEATPPTEAAKAEENVEVQKAADEGAEGETEKAAEVTSGDITELGDNEEDDEKNKKNKKSEVHEIAGDEMVEFIKSHKLNHEYDPVTDTFTFKCSARLMSSAVAAEVDPGDDIETIKAAHASKKYDFRPNDEELAQINTFTSRPHVATDFKVYAMHATNTQYDRSGERQSKKSLSEAAPKVPGTPLLTDHRMHSSDAVIGTMFHAEVKSDRQGGHYMLQKAYILDTAENQPLIKNIEAGIGNAVSVHTRSKRSDYLCDSCSVGSKKVSMYGNRSQNKSACTHYLGSMDESGKIVTATIDGCHDYLETSKVPVGDVPAARFKAAAIQQVSDQLHLEKSVNGDLVRLTTDVEEGVSTVDKEKSAKPTEPPAVTPAAPEVAPTEPMIVQVKADEALEKFSTGLDEFTVNLEKNLSSHIETFQKGLTAATEVITKQNDAMVTLTKGLEDQGKAHQAEIAEMRERFQVLADAHSQLIEMHKKLAETVNIAQATSIEELVNKLSNVRIANSKAISEQEKEKLAQVGGDVYKGLMDQFGVSVKG